MLPHLTALVVAQWPPQGIPFSTAAICRVVDCCPALRRFEVQLQEGASAAALTSLTSLSRLRLCGLSRDEVRSCLTALSQLQCLHVEVPVQVEGPALGLQDLLPLTVLTRLTHLSGGDTECGHGTVCLNDNFLSNSRPVWLQLLEQCATDPQAQPAVVSCVARQLQQQQEQGAQQAAQLQQQEVRLQVQELQLAAARAAAAAEAAVLHGQVQTLQAQLQEVLAALKQQRQD